jgi:MotA/TolQ/ExbB proton channel family
MAGGEAHSDGQIMTPPLRYLWRMLGFLLAVLAVTAVLSGALIDAFTSNPVLNTIIFCVLLVGIGWTLRQVLMLRPEVAWLEHFRAPRMGAPAQPAPRLLGPMASMFAARRADRLTLSAPAMRTVLDGIASRLDEQREVSRYMIGLLIFLGLLGTFWGLLLTIGSISDVIGNMSVGSGDLNQLFNQLKAGLAQPLRGMGTAFSASMLGLAGALVLGFLDLTAGQAQTRFFNELEEWLAGITRLSSGVLGHEGEGGSVPAYVQALLEQTAENLEGLQRTLERGEEGRAASAQALNTLTERLAVLADQMRAGQSLMMRVAEQQSTLGPALQRLADSQARGGGMDEQSRGYLRNTEFYLARLLEEVAQGRAQSTAEIRNEIKVLARTIAAIAEDAPR